MRMWPGNNETELVRNGWTSIVLNIDKITDINGLLDFLDSNRPGRWYVQLFSNPRENTYYFENKQTAVEFALRFSYAS